MQEPQTEGTAPYTPHNSTYTGATAPNNGHSPAGSAPPGFSDPTSPYNQAAYQAPRPVPSDGLSDAAAGAIAYITIVPAIVFLVLAPYSTRPFVKFHAIQCLGLAVTGFCLGLIAIIPILGWIVWLVGMIALVIVWVLSLVKASQGSYLKLPVISDFASQQARFPIA